MSTIDSGMKKIRNLLLKIRDNLTEAYCSCIDRKRQVVINEKIQDWIVEIESIVNNTRWNGMTLFGGSESVTYLEFSSIHEKISTQKISLVSGFDIASIGINRNEVTGYSESRTNFIEALSALHDAINEFDQVIVDIREFTARLNFMEEIFFIVRNNTQLVNNRIRNADMATERVEASTYLILQQTSTALQAQANMTPQFLLSLFT
jgi:flagellin